MKRSELKKVGFRKTKILRIMLYSVRIQLRVMRRLILMMMRTNILLIIL